MQVLKVIKLRFVALVFIILVINFGIFLTLMLPPNPYDSLGYPSINELLAAGLPDIFAVLYLSFVMAWAISYAVFFRFPRNFKVIFLGIIIASIFLTAAILIGEDRDHFPRNWSELNQVLYVYFASLLGAAFQLIFMAGGFQLIKVGWKWVRNDASWKKK